MSRDQTCLRVGAPLAIAGAVAVAWAVMAVAPGQAGWYLAAALVSGVVLWIRHRRIVARLRSRARALAQDNSQMALAVEMAEVGRWCIDSVNGRHLWSAEVCEIIGVPAGTRPDPALLARIAPDGLVQIDTVVAAHAQDRATYAVEFEILSPQRGERILRARARNVFAPEPPHAREQVLMVVRDITEDYLRLAEAETALGIAQAETARVRRLAETDALTGLPNRRAAMQALDREIIAARREGAPLSLALFDIDHFKAVNDALGHQAGDDVLRSVGRLVRGQMPADQCLARIGGEEFLCIFPGLGPAAIAIASEQIRRCVETGTRSPASPGVTISVGHATLGPRDTSLSLYARADEALYAAKRAGRNRVALAA